MECGIEQFGQFGRWIVNMSIDLYVVWPNASMKCEQCCQMSPWSVSIVNAV